MGNDGLGRRTFEYDSLDVVRSRRDYTYLPNGQLGTIAGKTAGNVAWTVTMRYDERGRPLTIVYSGGDSIELFWDESDRLIDTAITHASPISGVTIVRWHYHYVGGTLLAASRELSTPPVAPAIYPTIAVKRFWVITDERGLPHRVLDEQGAEYWKATWDASGWRTMQTQAAEMNWMPFGLPGQLVLRDTEAYASGTEGGTTVTRFRAPLILNQWRAYDALTGTYLQPDGADVLGRSDPEGYAYARSSPVAFEDSTGSKTSRQLDLPTIPSPWVTTFGEGCAATHPEIEAEWRRAIIEISDCPNGRCGGPTGDRFLRQWLFALQTGQIACSDGTNEFSVRLHNGQKKLYGSYSDGYLQSIAGAANAVTHVEANTFMWNRTTVVAKTIDKKTCLARVLAHEALHYVFPTLPITGRLKKADRLLADWIQYFAPAYNPLAISPTPAADSNHNEIKSGNTPLEMCVTCP